LIKLRFVGNNHFLNSIGLRIGFVMRIFSISINSCCIFSFVKKIKIYVEVRAVSPFTFNKNQLLVPFAFRATVMYCPGSASGIYYQTSLATSFIN
jgi:ribosome biogenesis protein Nip4